MRTERESSLIDQELCRRAQDLIAAAGRAQIAADEAHRKAEDARQALIDHRTCTDEGFATDLEDWIRCELPTGHDGEHSRDGRSWGGWQR